jgi:hypothetical protein
MRKRTYRVNGQVTISISTLVNAKSAEDAIRIATNRSMCAIYESGSDETEEWVTSGELDGEPRGLTAEEEKDEEEDDE